MRNYKDQTYLMLRLDSYFLSNSTTCCRHSSFYLSPYIVGLNTYKNFLFTFSYLLYFHGTITSSYNFFIPFAKFPINFQSLNSFCLTARGIYNWKVGMFSKAACSVIVHISPPQYPCRSGSVLNLHQNPRKSQPSKTFWIYF